MTVMEFWKKHGREKVMALCEKAGTKYEYWKHLAHRRKRPSVDLARRMVKLSGGEMSLDDLLTPKSQMKTR